jgi:beta-fructofuranosidase
VSAGERPVAGFRLLASDQEWTDVYSDPGNETLVVDRSASSLIPSCASPSILYS